MTEAIVEALREQDAKLSASQQLLGREKMKLIVLTWADENAAKLREAGLMASLLRAVS